MIDSPAAPLPEGPPFITPKQRSSVIRLSLMHTYITYNVSLRLCLPGSLPPSLARSLARILLSFLPSLLSNSNPLGFLNAQFKADTTDRQTDVQTDSESGLCRFRRRLPLHSISSFPSSVMFDARGERASERNPLLPPSSPSSSGATE